MEVEDVLTHFKNQMTDNPDTPQAVAAISSLINYIDQLHSAETLFELRHKLTCAITKLTNIDSSVASVTSGCELFLRFITLTSLDHPDFQECKRVLVERGKLFLETAASSRNKITKFCHHFIKDGVTVLTHSKSRLVLKLFKTAANQNRRFNVFITQSAPNMSGYEMQKELEKAGIPSTVILDSAVGYIMEKVDFVLVGAEGVVESGGIINKIGTYQIAIVAKAANKPFHVVAESYKFVRIYPLNQKDVPDKWKYSYTTDPQNKDHPLVDYTPPSYINLLLTDLGILTPSAVSDELIKLYC